MLILLFILCFPRVSLPLLQAEAFSRYILLQPVSCAISGSPFLSFGAMLLTSLVFVAQLGLPSFRVSIITQLHGFRFHFRFFLSDVPARYPPFGSPSFCVPIITKLETRVNAVVIGSNPGKLPVIDGEKTGTLCKTDNEVKTVIYPNHHQVSGIYQ
ncbi:hypothetical protein K438DRAFT_1942150 [Mycena galopus ATCC 62051]|nr:hypothetical protein K438DRAFT_1942150 [Mycena galopus ATCC 62051]